MGRRGRADLTGGSLVALLTLLAVGCQPSSAPSTSSSRPVTTSTRVAEEATPETGDPFEYRIAIFGEPSSVNPWAVLDDEASAWNFYVVPPYVSLYTYQPPTYTFVPLLAADDEPPTVVEDADGWSVTVHVRDDVTWSDGLPVTASDVAFSFETVAQFGLGANFLTLWPVAVADDPGTEEDESHRGITSVEATDDHTVVISFNFYPGVAVWPFAVGTAPVFSESFWRPVADSVADGKSFKLASGLGSPTASGFVSESFEAGAYWRSDAVPDYWDRGSRYAAYANGAVEYTGPHGRTETYAGPAEGAPLASYEVGPYADAVLYSYYSDQNAAVLALAEGEVDFLLNPVGLGRGLQQLVVGNPELEVVINEANGFRYLAFNLRKFPMRERPFRQAIACMIDKHFVANQVLAGAAIPVESFVPPGNSFWFNPDVATLCSGLTAEQRLVESVRILRDAGWSWDVEPAWNPDEADVEPRGTGLRGPDGTAVPPLTLLAPGPGYDPLRATYGLYVEQWAMDLGIPLDAEPTGFNVIIDAVFNPDDVLSWDMYILGWGLTPIATHVFDFFRSESDVALGGFNNTGYLNPALDSLAAEFDTVKTLEGARELVFLADALLAEDLPYVVLFTTPIIEAYRVELDFPFTDTLNGIEGWSGLPALVRHS